MALSTDSEPLHEQQISLSTRSEMNKSKNENQSLTFQPNEEKPLSGSNRCDLSDTQDHKRRYFCDENDHESLKTP